MPDPQTPRFRFDDRPEWCSMCGRRLPHPEPPCEHLPLRVPDVRAGVVAGGNHRGLVDAVLMERIDISSWCTLYHADATEILDVLREHAPDAVIMDPPYGIGFTRVARKPSMVVYTRANGKTESYARKCHSPDTVQGDDSVLDLSPWLDFPQVLLWGADHQRAQLPAGGRFLVWDKLAGMPARDTFSDAECAWHSATGKTALISHMWKGFMADKRGGEHPQAERLHPMQKPVRVMQWCIRECRLSRGATILDPYMGSGTTGIAAFGMDMRFVGVEIERRWFDAAVKRITERCDEGLFPVGAERMPAEQQQDVLFDG